MTVVNTRGSIAATSYKYVCVCVCVCVCADIDFYHFKYLHLIHAVYPTYIGYYCVPDLVQAGDIQTIYTPCPAGYYCPNGTHYNWQPCPAGTYSNSEMLGKAEDCTACDPGYYCNGMNVICTTW